MQKIIPLLLLVIVPCMLWAQVYTIETVPNTKVQSNKLVTNPNGILSQAAEDQLNVLLDSIERKTSSQVAVVMLNSIGDADEFEFAQTLFKKWGIGQAGNDNGLLILFVSDKHIIRFHTGYGLEGMLPDVICKRIQMQKMVPLFKEGKIDEGMIAGVLEVQKILSDPQYSPEINTSEKASTEFRPEDWLGVAIIFGVPWFLTLLIVYAIRRGMGRFPNSKKYTKGDAPHVSLNSGQWFWWYVVAPPVLLVALSAFKSGTILFAGFYGYFLLQAVVKFMRMNNVNSKLRQERKYNDSFSFYKEKKGSFLFLTLLFPLPLIFLFIHYIRQLHGVRNAPRPCTKCAGKMHKLDEVKDNEFLTQSMITEENIKSVDYDVWLCNTCQEIEIEAFYNERTKYVLCPKCSSITFYESGRKTIKHATEHASGQVSITSTCKHCRHQKTETEIIPQIVYSSSSDSSSSSSWSSSSSSDSGGSFGGGDSGGGGASSSW